MTEQKEIWKEIPGYEPYQISNLGRVLSPKRKGVKKDRLLKPNTSCTGGYLFVVLMVAGNRHTMKIHKLLQSTFMEDKTACIDHKNGIKTDNRLGNLRLCTQQQNTFNRKKGKGTSSIFKGVDFHKHSRKWRARIRHNDKLIHLGLSVNEKDAALAYNKKALELFGKFAKLNFEDLKNI
jgi:hypothetical protein